MADINLLQNQLKDTTLTASRRSMTAIWILTFVLVVLVLGGGALYLLTRNLTTESSQLTTDNTRLQKEIQNSSEDIDKAKVLQAKLSNASLLLKNHIHISPLLDEIEEFTYRASKYVNISIDEVGLIHLEGTVSSYSDLGKLLLGLSTSEYFESVRLLSVAGGSEANTYHFSINMKATAELYSISNK